VTQTVECPALQAQSRVEKPSVPPKKQKQKQKSITTDKKGYFQMIK
jgi:hypothetical protein